MIGLRGTVEAPMLALSWSSEGYPTISVYLSDARYLPRVYSILLLFIRHLCH